MKLWLNLSNYTFKMTNCLTVPILNYKSVFKGLQISMWSIRFFLILITLLAIFHWNFGRNLIHEIIYVTSWYKLRVDLINFLLNKKNCSWSDYRTGDFCGQKYHKFFTVHYTINLNFHLHEFQLRSEILYLFRGKQVFLIAKIAFILLY